MPSVEQNRIKWGRLHNWSRDGDEWRGMAAYCGQSYDDWKQSIVDEFIAPFVSRDSVVLEVAPGHGRWTDHLVRLAGRVILVDLNESCVDYCRNRFRAFTNVEYHHNDGRSLPMVADESVDFIWSFDSFVHIEADVIDAYVGEFGRVLKPNGLAAIHHAGRRHSTLWLGWLLRLGRVGRRVYQVISQGRLARGDGWRSNISRQMVGQIVARHGLGLAGQIDTWGGQGQFSIRKYHDAISRISKPAALATEPMRGPPAPRAATMAHG